jgi:signal transduction histidine kinase
VTDITDAGPRLKAMNDRLDELRAAADQADAEYREEIARLRLTDDEREAVAVAAEAYASDHGERFAATLRALLARLSPPAT